VAESKDNTKDKREKIFLKFIYKMVQVQVQVFGQYNNVTATSSASSSAPTENEAYLSAREIAYNEIINILQIPQSQSPDLVETTILNVDNNPPIYKNYLNGISGVTVPKLSCINELVPFTSIDTIDFYIDPQDNTKLVCNNPGLWFINAQFKINCLSDCLYTQEGQINIWPIFNGVSQQGFDNGWSLAKVNCSAVIPSGYAAFFKAGDYIQYGIQQNGIWFDKLIVVCSTTERSSSGVTCPSVNLSGFKLLTNNTNDSGFQNYSIISTTINLPSIANQYQYILFNSLNSYDFTININNNAELICNNPGKWFIFSQIQVYGYNDTTIGTDNIVNTFISVNSNNIQNSAMVTSPMTKSSLNMIANSYAYTFKQNDILQFGIKSCSLNNTLNSGFFYYTPYTTVADFPAINIAMKLPTFSNEKNSTGFVGYSNIISSPSFYLSKPNQNELVEVVNNEPNNIDFAIENTNIICNNPGKWLISAQYTIYSINITQDGNQSKIDGWLIFNGTSIQNSDASQTAINSQEQSVFNISYIQEFKQNDILQLGVRSSSLDGNLNVTILTWGDTQNINPAVSLTLIKIDE